MSAITHPEQAALVEARLLNAKRLRDWLDLFAAEAWYWIPLRPEQTEPHGALSLLYEDRQLMEARVMRLVHPHAWSQQPAPRSVRVVADVHTVAADEAAGRWETMATFMMMEYRQIEARPESRRIFAGTLRHGIVRRDGALKIASKRIDLVDCEAGFSTVTEPL